MLKLIVFGLLLLGNVGFSQSKTLQIARQKEGLGVEGVDFFQDKKMDYYDIKYLKLDIIVQPRSVSISANCTYKVQVKQALDTFVIEFKETMILDSVLINNNKSTFARSNHHIYVPLNPGAITGEILNVAFYYKGNVESGFYAGIDDKGFEYAASVSEAYKAREWFPAKQLLNDKIDSTDIWITTGSAYKAGSNGLLTSVLSLANNQTQYRWSTRYPLSYYMPSVAVGNYLEYKLYTKPAAMVPDSLLIQNLVYSNPSYFASVKTQIDKTSKFVEKFSDLFGLYPFYKEKYGHAQANIGGGMEHATMTTLQSFEEDLVAHELAHQWFGNNVTCATWNDIWMNESFATYSQYLMQQYLPALFSKPAEQSMNEFHDNVLSQPGGSVIVPLSQTYDEGRIFDYRLTYAKGATALHNLRFEMQSDTLFFNTLKLYQQKFKDGFATTADFKQIAEQVSGKNLANFFNERIYGEGYPTYNVTFLKHGADSLILNVNQVTSMPSVTPLFTGLVQFKISSAQGDTTVTVNQTTNNQTFAIYYTKTPNGIIIDPNNWIVNKTGIITEGKSTTPELPKAVSVVPNPVSNQVTITMPVNAFNSLRILDINGRVMSRTSITVGITSFKQNVPFASGIYFIQLIGEKESVVKKVLVQHK